MQTLCDLAPVGDGPEILFCWKKRRKVRVEASHGQGHVAGADSQADKRFFTMLKKHFDSKPVEDDRPGEKERYTRDGVSLIRLTRRR